MSSISDATFKLARFAGNPVISPLADSDWQSLVTTNPAAIIEEETGDVLMLYRAAGDDADHRVHLGLARSKDGFHFERCQQLPVLSPNQHSIDGGCIEDPRIIRMDGWYWVTAASLPFPPGRYWTYADSTARPANDFPASFPRALKQNLASTQLYLTRDFTNWIRAGRLTDASLDDRDVLIFPSKVNGKWVTLHRPMQWHGCGYPNPYPAMWIAFSDDLLQWKQLQLLACGEAKWERKIGANNPPLRTDAGWLQIYHGVGEDRKYRLGAMLLDLTNPAIVTHRTPLPIFEPEARYEAEGLYNGVCFPCGHVVKDGTYFLYYGGADTYCCLATAKLDDFVDHLLQHPAHRNAVK